MKQKDKELLLKDLSARLPYNLKGKVYAEVTDGDYDMNGDMIFYDAPFDVILDKIDLYEEIIHVTAIGNKDTVEFIEIQQTDGEPYTIEEFKPYLRPLSSMTEEEKKDILQSLNIHGDIDNECNLLLGVECDIITLKVCKKYLGELNKRMFDVCHMIEKGLALKAPEDMYIKNNKIDTEDKPTLKFFQEGDWIIYNNEVCQIKHRENGFNLLTNIYGIQKEPVNERNLSTARHWTIQDAKPGDILSWDHERYTIIFMRIQNSKIIAYCSYNSHDDHFGAITLYDTQFDLDLKFQPASKTAKDVLLLKIKENNYEWDPYKLTLSITTTYNKNE